MVNTGDVEQLSDENIKSKNNKNIKNDDMQERKKRSIVILGDSILKEVELHKVRNSLESKEKVYVMHFSGATINHIKSYAIPSKVYENDLVIFHCGTNDLRTSKEPKAIADEIIDLALDLKTEKMY